MQWESAASPTWRQYESMLARGAPAYLAEHRLFHTAVLPGVAYLEMALAAGEASPPWRVTDVAWQQALVWESDAARVVQTVLRPDGEAASRWEVFSRAEGETNSDAWRRHAEGRLVRGDTPPPSAVDLTDLQARLPDEVPLEGFYERLAAQGLQYGPGFRGLKRLWRDGDEVLGAVELPEALRREAGRLLSASGVVGRLPARLGRRRGGGGGRGSLRAGAGGRGRCLAACHRHGALQPRAAAGRRRRRDRRRDALRRRRHAAGAPHRPAPATRQPPGALGHAGERSGGVVL